MGQTQVIEYQMLAAGERAASVSLFWEGLRHTILLQLARVATGLGPAFSVYAVYREGQMTFEASARLQVSRPRRPPETLLHELMHDADFLQAVLAPMRLQVDKHFALLQR